jgi:hypothetical protein
MAEPLSMDLRRRVLAAIAAGVSTATPTSSSCPVAKTRPSCKSMTMRRFRGPSAECITTGLPSRYASSDRPPQPQWPPSFSIVECASRSWDGSLAISTSAKRPRGGKAHQPAGAPNSRFRRRTRIVFPYRRAVACPASLRAQCPKMAPRCNASERYSLD